MGALPLFLISLTACLLCIDVTNGLSFHCLTAPILTAFAISWPTAYIPRLLRGVVQLAVGELLIAVCIVDCYCQEFFSSPITPQILSNTMLSNGRELSEFLSSFVGLYVLGRWRMAALLLMVVALPFALFILRKPVIGNKVVYIIGVVLLGVCLICEIPPTCRYLQLFSQGGDLQTMEGLIFRHYHEEVPTPLHRLAFAWHSIRKSSLVLGDIKRSTFSARIDSCSHLSPHIVLVIGESYNKHHSTLYGYQLPTTPLQQKRMDDGELFVFDDVVTPWNITSNVFLDIFSLWEYGMTESIGTMPLFPILFRRAGYEVRFFSNQYLLRGFMKGATNQAGHFFLADGELSDSLFTFRNRKSGKYDLGLVRQVGDYRRNHADRNYTLDIIHLIGQHFDYAMRYPPSEAHFSPKDYADREGDKNAKTMMIEYDNATRYNDMVVDSILSLYENDDAVVLYVADHGEEVYDELPVHGRLFQEPTAAQAKYEFEVPMWIWSSNTYRQHHAEVLQRLSASVVKPLLTDHLPYVLLYLAGIYCCWSDDMSNILSPAYQPGSRMIGSGVDYDTLMNR